MVEYGVRVLKPSNISRHRRLAGLAALIAGLALVVSACSSTSDGSPQQVVTVTASNTATAPAGSSTPAPAPTTSKAAKPVHVKLTNSDGATYGVGMPIIAYFSRKITDATAFNDATKVTVDDTPVKGAWFFEYSAAFKGYPIEAHYRLQKYWPAHATIHMDLPVKGLSAGEGLEYDNSLTLDFATGAANIVTVDDSTHTVTVVSDGKQWGKFPTSLGAPDTRTRRGTKVIMEKGRSICMKGPGYNECGVKFTQRLTYDGEYLHAAPWNTYNITHGVDSSNGCTNLLTSDAEKLYDFLGIGDVVLYPNANGPRMQLGEGYGDWNVPWSQWQTGGII